MFRLHPPLTRRALRLALACGLCLATPMSVTAADPAREATPRQPVLMQKVRLIEQLLASPRAKELEAGADADARAALARARALLAEARTAPDDIEGEARLNEALRLATQVARARAASRDADETQRRRNVELREQIATHRSALASWAQARGQPAPPALATVDRQLADAQALSAEARHADAGRVLADAQRVAIETLIALRSGETVTIELKFDTPADEYAYEEKRWHSHELLVDMALDERKPAGSVRAAIDQHLQQARALRRRAADSAAAGDHRSGIKSLEEATRLLVRALQTAGMPVF